MTSHQSHQTATRIMQKSGELEILFCHSTWLVKNKFESDIQTCGHISPAKSRGRETIWTFGKIERLQRQHLGSHDGHILSQDVCFSLHR
jgi:hypothetical protein